MYAIIRRYQTDSASEITKAVTEKFVPRIKQLPGFVAYYGIDSTTGFWASVVSSTPKPTRKSRVNWLKSLSKKTVSS
jgi:hypothetical protein